MSVSKVLLFGIVACIAATPIALSADNGIDPFALYVQAGIDPSQHAQIAELGSQLEQTNIGRAHEIMGLIQNIRTLSLQVDLDEKKILSTQNRINELQAAMANDRLKLNLKVRRLLTPAQRAKLVSLIKEQRAAPSTHAP